MLTNHIRSDTANISDDYPKQGEILTKEVGYFVLTKNKITDML